MAATNETTKMTYRFLGNSGLLVSKLGLGSWMSGTPEQTSDLWFDVVKTAFEYGINFFDTAEPYDFGHAEVLLGKAVQRGIVDGLWTREDFVITTKLYYGTKGYLDGGPNDQGNSRKHLVEGIKNSLRRLQLEYVDVVYCHRPEKFTPIEETVRAMNFIINQGWAFYWGTSEWPSALIKEACDVADRLGLIRPIVEQPQYNILERSMVEFEFADLYKSNKLGLTVWSPLASGLLTGKYNKEAPEGSRLSSAAYRAMVPDFDGKVAITRQLAPIAVKLGCSLAQLAIAWCVSNENVSTVLLGARNPAQLEETIKSLGFVDKLTPEVKAEIDAVVKFVPKRWAPDMFYTVRGRHLVAASEEKPAWAAAFAAASKKGSA